MKTQENTEQLGARDFADRIETFVATVTGRPARKLTDPRPMGKAAGKPGRHYHYKSQEKELLVCVRPYDEPIGADLLTNWLVTASELDLALRLMPASTLYVSLTFGDCLAERGEAEGVGEAEGRRRQAEVEEVVLVPVHHVVRCPDGRKYVAKREHRLPSGAEIVADRPHGDGDFSYVCGRNHCRCMD